MSPLSYIFWEFAINPAIETIREQTEEARSTVSQQLKQKPYYRKLITMKKQKVISQMNRRDKVPEKKKLMQWRQATSQKRIQKNDSEDNPDLGKRMEKMQEMFTKDPEELKNKQKEMNNTLEGIKSRITEAEELISDLENRMMEIIAAKQNIEKRMKRNEDSLRDLWDNIKCTNIHIIGVPEGEERKDLRKYLKR